MVSQVTHRIIMIKRFLLIGLSFISLAINADKVINLSQSALIIENVQVKGGEIKYLYFRNFLPNAFIICNVKINPAIMIGEYFFGEKSQWKTSLIKATPTIAPDNFSISFATAPTSSPLSDEVYRVSLINKTLVDTNVTITCNMNNLPNLQKKYDALPLAETDQVNRWLGQEIAPADAHLFAPVNVTNPIEQAILSTNLTDRRRFDGFVDTRRFSVCPLNYGIHWGVFVIEHNALEFRKPEVYFFESVGLSSAIAKLNSGVFIRKIDIVDGILKASPYTQANIHDVSPYSNTPFSQNGGVLCSAWTIEAAKAIITARKAGAPIGRIEILETNIEANLRNYMMR